MVFKEISSNFKGKRCLVTGGTGFIGSNIAKQLLQEGVHVRVISHKRKMPFCHKKLEIINGNLTEYDFCKEVVKDVDIVFNCASFTSGSFNIVNNPSLFIMPNLMINAQMVDACCKASVEKFIFISSAIVYPEKNTPHKEECVWKDDVPKSYEALGWLNRYLEKLFQFYHDNFDINICVVRASSVYGEGDNFDLKTGRVIPSLINKISSSKNKIEVWGDGSCIRDFIYIDDLVRGIFLAMKYYSCGKPINIASGVSYSVDECIEKIFSITGKKLDIIYNKDKPSTVSKTRIDINLANEKINFKPLYSFEEGIKKTIEWYNDNLKEKR